MEARGNERNVMRTGLTHKHTEYLLTEHQEVLTLP